MSVTMCDGCGKLTDCYHAVENVDYPQNLYFYRPTRSLCEDCYQKFVVYSNKDQMVKMTSEMKSAMEEFKRKVICLYD